MWKKTLLLLLGIAFFIELVFSLCAFAVPQWFLTQFKVTPSSDTLFLGHVLAWFLLLMTINCGLAIRWVSQGAPHGRMLSMILGLWWIGIGLGIYFVCGRPDNLFLDSLKGALICLAAFQAGKAHS